MPSVGYFTHAQAESRLNDSSKLERHQGTNYARCRIHPVYFRVHLDCSRMSIGRILYLAAKTTTHPKGDKAPPETAAF